MTNRTMFIAPPSPLVGEGLRVRGRSSRINRFRESIWRETVTPTDVELKLCPHPNPSPRGGGAAGREGWKLEKRQKDFASTNARAKRLRKEMTFAEKQMWKLLKQIPDGHFRKQVPIGAYVFDFADHGAKLIIEVDGGIHRLPDVQIKDAEKEAFAKAQGYRFFRFTNEEVIGGPDCVFSKVEEAVRRPHP